MRRDPRHPSPHPAPWLRALLLVAILALTAWGCDDEEPEPEPEPLPAENVFVDNLGDPLPTATPAQLETFEAGREVALKRFDKDNGLGPQFNVTFCAACHEKPVTGGSAPRYRNFLLVSNQFSDGSVIPVGVNGIQTQFHTDGHRVDDAVDGNLRATRNAIPFFGVGLLAELHEASILEHADPDDEDGDGISGRPNYDRGFVGRFGRKAQTVSIEGFIRGPLFNHLGVTSVPLSNERKNALPVPSGVDPDAPATRDDDVAAGGRFVTHEFHQAAAPDEPNFDDDGVPDPELSEQELFDLVSFSMLLAPPRPDAPTPATEHGAELFEEANCSGCHVPALEGPRGLVFAYTDLLLHDMGPDMADGIRQGVATGSEFRTQPLWGIASVGPFLHDGRADTLDEAIRAHGGEAEASRDAYVAMRERDRADLVAFLESLGGASQRSDGLIPPGAPVPAAGEPGGPIAELSGADLTRFEQGRAVFDRDAHISAGLGPYFNGDSCRACHFDPVVGGAGPAGLNVSRHGSVDMSSGAFTAPGIGTMAHRLAVSNGERPPYEFGVNTTELRQTPSLLGLGLLERVPDETLLTTSDPQDADGDGLSGRAHVLADGRIGRLGWKANVPDLQEFARDALSNEMGITLPEHDRLTFGFIEDDDASPDPEISEEDVDALVFYMQQLAPPAPRSTDPEAEALGLTIFGELGCDGCHTPQLTLQDGTRIAPYTDLLLHDIAAPDALGIADGDATIHEFRTAPLWGIRDTAPYMHHGMAPTLDAAIREHHGEADAARAGYEALADGEQAALVTYLESL